MRTRKRRKSSKLFLPNQPSLANPWVYDYLDRHLRRVEHTIQYLPLLLDTAKSLGAEILINQSGELGMSIRLRILQDTTAAILNYIPSSAKLWWTPHAGVIAYHFIKCYDMDQVLTQIHLWVESITI